MSKKQFLRKKQDNERITNEIGCHSFYLVSYIHACMYMVFPCPHGICSDSKTERRICMHNGKESGRHFLFSGIDDCGGIQSRNRQYFHSRDIILTGVPGTAFGMWFMAITTESSAALVPMMSALFLAIAPFPIITHFSQILLALSAVLKDAFHFQVFFIVFTGFSSSSDILMGREAVVPIIASYCQQKTAFAH